MLEYSKKFLALDLETTHLDVRQGRIMEVGIAESEIYFDPSSASGGSGGEVKVRFGQTFNTLVNPEIEPPQTALALTGIKVEDLEMAPKWRDAKKNLEKFFKDKILLGQNVGFDIDFLKNQGVRLKNPFVDTLDIAQTFLPLFPVHSLEYLSQEFGAPLGGSHRALADCQNTALVLAGIANEFLSFEPSLQKQIKEFLGSSSLVFRDIFLDLPEARIKKPSVQAGLPPKVVPSEKIKVDLKDKSLISLPLGFKSQIELLNFLASEKFAGLVGIPYSIFLDFLPEDQVIIDPSWALCSQKYEWLKSQTKLSNPALKVLMKISIFQHFRNSPDLSKVKWTYSEREILPLILVESRACSSHQCTFAKSLHLSDGVVFFSSLSVIFKLIFEWGLRFRERKLVLFDLPRIEEEFAESQIQIWNLKKIRTLIAAIFPLQKGQLSRFARLPKEVDAAANELDLFFGILHLVYLKKEGEFSENLIVDENETESERFKKFFHPAQKMINKLDALTAFFQDQAKLNAEMRIEIENLAANLFSFRKFLNEFFIEQSPALTSWLKFNSEWVDLNASPKKIENLWREFEKNFRSLTVIDIELPKLSLAYYQTRLGLNLPVLQQESPKAVQIEAKIFQKTPTTSEIVDLCRGLSGRKLIILPNESKLTEYYELFTKDSPRPIFQEKKPAPDKQVLPNLGSQLFETREKMERGKKLDEYDLLAFRFSGNLQLLMTKMEKMSASGTLLLTLNIFLKYFHTLPPFEHLIILRLPFEAPSARPDLISAQNRFLDHVLPRSVTILHLILSRFTASEGTQKEVYILDSRILTDYDQAFLKYLESLPNLRLSTI